MGMLENTKAFMALFRHRLERYVRERECSCGVEDDVVRVDELRTELEVELVKELERLGRKAGEA